MAVPVSYDSVSVQYSLLFDCLKIRFFLFDYAEMTPVSNAPSVDAHIVGNAFVQEYYIHLYEKPAEVYRFYLEESVLGRPGPDGEMVSVKSLKVCVLLSKGISITKL